MKKILYIMLMSAVGLVSCKDENYSPFEGDTTLHFAVNESQLDSISYSFLSTPDNTLTVQLPVEIAGYADRARTFALEIDKTKSTAVEGVHFQPLEKSYTMEAGVYNKNITITFIKTKEMDDKVFRLVVKLKPIDGFDANGIVNRQKLTLLCSSTVPAISTEDWEVDYLYIFGNYSKTKHRHILLELREELALAKIKFENVQEWGSLSSSLKNAYGSKMNLYFTNNKIIDEYGNPIEPWK